ncbi:4502_t:CDS:2, partial [Acaulospora colombiana]
MHGKGGERKEKKGLTTRQKAITVYATGPIDSPNASPFLHIDTQFQTMDAVPTSAPLPSANASAPAAQQQPRTKSKAYQTTIAAEADDLKYESKYKELKKKVKEVEE